MITIRLPWTTALTLLIVFLVGTRTVATVAQTSAPPPAFGQPWTQQQGAIPATVLALGRWFTVNQSFSARIVGTQITSYVGSGPSASQAAPNEFFVILTLEMGNNANVALRPPIQNIQGLTTRDGVHSFRLDQPRTNQLNSARTSISSNSSATILAIYRLPRGIDLGSLYYNVLWDQAAHQFVLAPLPPPR